MTIKVPDEHEWEKIQPMLWFCPWCSFYCISHDTPGNNSTAISEAEAKKQLSNMNKKQG